MSGFTIRNSGFYFYPGIYIESCYNAISGNIITDNNWGIFLPGSSNNKIFENIISNNLVYGVFLAISFDNAIFRNKITNNEYGIYLRFSSNNSFNENTIINNIRYGVYLEFLSNNNTIFHNTFRRNLRHAYFDNSYDNKWNGNYWNRPRLLPKPILGKITHRYREIYRVNFDWHPSIKPYNT